MDDSCFCCGCCISFLLSLFIPLFVFYFFTKSMLQASAEHTITSSTLIALPPSLLPSLPPPLLSGIDAGKLSKARARLQEVDRAMDRIETERRELKIVLGSEGGRRREEEEEEDDDEEEEDALRI